MRFRVNGKTMTPRIVRLAAAAIALSAIIAGAPALAAGASNISSKTSVMGVKTHRVPSVVGLIASNAVAALDGRGFVTILKAPPGHRVVKAANWTVAKQSPKAGMHLAVGSKVTLAVIKTTTYLAQGIRRFYSQDYGTFPAIIRTGTGDRTIALPKGITSAIVFSSYTGGGRFTVSELSAGNAATKRVLVNATKRYAGTQAFGLVSVKARTTAIRVSGSGTWRITIKPIAAVPIMAVPVKSTGDRVYLYSGPSAMWTVSSPGPTTFILNQISSSSYPNLAVNESGSWAGPVALQPGPSVIEIHSNGAWTIH